MAELYLKRQKENKNNSQSINTALNKIQYSILNKQVAVYKTMHTDLKSAGNSINAKSDGRKNKNKYFTFPLAIK